MSVFAEGKEQQEVTDVALGHQLEVLETNTTVEGIPTAPHQTHKDTKIQRLSA